MRKGRFTEEQTMGVLKEHQAGPPTAAYRSEWILAYAATTPAARRPMRSTRSEAMKQSAPLPAKART
jgi:hypothetical protein